MTKNERYMAEAEAFNRALQKAQKRVEKLNQEVVNSSKSLKEYDDLLGDINKNLNELAKKGVKLANIKITSGGGKGSKGSIHTESEEEREERREERKERRERERIKEQERQADRKERLERERIREKEREEDRRQRKEDRAEDQRIKEQERQQKEQDKIQREQRRIQRELQIEEERRRKEKEEKEQKEQKEQDKKEKKRGIIKEGISGVAKNAAKGNISGVAVQTFNTLQKLGKVSSATAIGVVALVGSIALLSKAALDAQKNTIQYTRAMVQLGYQLGTIEKGSIRTSNAFNRLSNRWSNLWQEVGEFFQPVLEGFAELADALLASLGTSAEEPKQKVLGTKANIASQAKQSGFSMSSASTLAENTYTIANQIATQYGKEGQASEIADSLADAWLNGSEAAKEYGVVVNDYVLTGYMATRGIDIANVEITDAMKQYYRYQLMIEQASQGNSANMQNLIKQWTQLGFIIDKTKNKLFSFDEVITLAAIDSRIPEVGNKLEGGVKLPEGEDDGPPVVPTPKPVTKPITDPMAENIKKIEVVPNPLPITPDTVNLDETQVAVTPNPLPIDTAVLDNFALAFVPYLENITSAVGISTTALNINTQAINNSNQNLNNNTQSNIQNSLSTGLNTEAINNNTQTLAISNQTLAQAVGVINTTAGIVLQGADTIQQAANSEVQASQYNIQASQNNLQAASTGIQAAGIISGAFGSLGGIAQSIAQAFTAGANSIRGAISSAASEAIKKVNGVGQSGVQRVNGATNQGINILNNLITTGLKTLNSQTGSGVNTINRSTNRGVDNILTNMRLSIGNIQDSTRSGLSNIQEGTRSGLSSIQEGTNSGVGAIQDSTRSGLNNMNDTGSYWVNRISEAASKALSRLSGRSTSTSSTSSKPRNKIYGNVQGSDNNKNNINKIYGNLQTSDTAAAASTSKPKKSSTVKNIAKNATLGPIKGGEGGDFAYSLRDPKTRKYDLSVPTIASTYAHAQISQVKEPAKKIAEGYKSVFEAAKRPEFDLNEKYGIDSIDQYLTLSDEDQIAYFSELQALGGRVATGNLAMFLPEEALSDIAASGVVLGDISAYTANIPYKLALTGGKKGAYGEAIIGEDIYGDLYTKLDIAAQSLNKDLERKGWASRFLDEDIKIIESQDASLREEKLKSRRQGLALGGVGTKELNNVSLFENNKKEAVIPLETTEGIQYLSDALREAGYLGEAGGSSYTINLTLSGVNIADDEEQWRAVAQRIAEEIDIQRQRRGELSYGSTF